MGIMLVLAIIVILGFISYQIYQNTSWANEGWLIGGVCAMGVGGLILILCGACCLGNNYTISAEKEYQDLVHTKEIIEYRLENFDKEDNVTVNGGVYNDVIEYNNKIREYKMYTYDFWQGWFYADKPAELDYIIPSESVS